MQKNIKLLFTVLLFCNFHSFSQNLSARFDLYTSQNGLSGNKIKCMLQDSKGYIWLGGYEGLNRFDGNEFEIFRKSGSDTNSLQGNLVVCLAEDKNHLLWIGYQNGGLSSYDQEKKKFTHYYSGSCEGCLPPGGINTLFVDRNNTLWLGVEGKGLIRFEQQSGKFFIYASLPDINPFYPPDIQKVYNNVYYIYEDETSLFWIATHNGLYTFDNKKSIFTPIREKPVDPKSFRNDLFGKIVKGKNQDLWMCSWGGGLTCYNYLNNSWENFKYDHININTATTNIIKDICFKNDSELWIASADNNLGSFNIRTKEFHFYDLSNTASLDNIPISVCERVMVDRDGNTWIAHFNGLSRLRSPDSQFNFTPLPVNHSDNGSFYFLTDFFENKEANELYISTSFAEGLYVRNNQTGNITNYPLPRRPVNTEGYQLIPDLLSDRNKNLWILTDDCLLLFDYKKHQYIIPEQPPLEKIFKGSPVFVKLFEDTFGNIWIISERQGAYCFNPFTSQFTHFLSSGNSEKNEICSNLISAIAEDGNHNIWLGSYGNGLSIYHPDKNSFTHYQNDKFKKNSLCSNRILSMSSDKRGNVWIGTFDGGLCKATWDKNNKATFFAYNFNNGLPSDNVYCVQGDIQGMIWCATALSLSRINPETNQITSFDSRNNLKSNFVFYKIREGLNNDLLAGLEGGYYRFSSAIKPDTGKALVQIKSFRVFDKEVSLQPDQQNQYSVSLSYNQNFFSCNFTVINFLNPEKNQFAFQLEGLDKDTISNGNRRFISYTNVPPGHYVLHLIASNGDGIWNNEGIKIGITIRPPFWQTPLFRITSMVFLLLIIVSAYRWRLKKITKEETRKTEINRRLAEIKLSALQSQMNPHFVFNSLNAIQQIIHSGDKNEALDYLSKFSKLIRNILNHSSRSTVSLADEIEMLHLYLDMEVLRFDKVFNYSITCDPSIHQQEVEIPPMLIQPFAENAIIHGLLNKKEKGQLQVSFFKEDSMILCTVEDNGIGRAAASQLKKLKTVSHQSMGIKMISERLETLSLVSGQKASYSVSDLKDNENNPCGTKVIVIIPLTEK